MTVHGVRGAAAGGAELSCAGCGQSLRLSTDPGGDARLTAFVTRHRGCLLDGGDRCDACVDGHVCWTCEDEVGCHPEPVGSAANARCRGSAAS